MITRQNAQRLKLWKVTPREANALKRNIDIPNSKNDKHRYKHEYISMRSINGNPHEIGHVPLPFQQSYDRRTFIKSLHALHFLWILIISFTFVVPIEDQSLAVFLPYKESYLIGNAFILSLHT